MCNQASGRRCPRPLGYWASGMASMVLTPLILQQLKSPFLLEVCVFFYLELEMQYYIRVY